MTSKIFAQIAVCALTIISLILTSTSASEIDNVPKVQLEKDGAAVIHNIAVPVPAAASEQARQMIQMRNLHGDPTHGLALPAPQIRHILDPLRNEITAKLRRQFEVKIESRQISGVRVHIVSPARLREGGDKSILINVHAGAFMFNKGSVTEAIPIAALTGLRVIAVDYRLAPEHPFPAAIEDIVTVYREVLKDHKPENIGIYGSSSGSTLSVQSVLLAKQQGMPMPGAVGFFSGTTDFARPGDSEYMFGFLGFSTHIAPVAEQGRGFIGKTNLKNPLLSPLYADLRGFPPVLCMTGTRDFFLSGTVNFHRALLRAGVKAELIVFDGMPHIHWDDPDLPESREAWQQQADFLLDHVLKK